MENTKKHTGYTGQSEKFQHIYNYSSRMSLQRQGMTETTFEELMAKKKLNNIQEASSNSKQDEYKEIRHRDSIIKLLKIEDKEAICKQLEEKGIIFKRAIIRLTMEWSLQSAKGK